MSCGVRCAPQMPLTALLTVWADPASRKQECKLAIVSGRTRSLTLLTSCSVHCAPLSLFFHVNKAIILCTISPKAGNGPGMLLGSRL